MIFKCVRVPVRKSKAADQRRRSLAKQTREDHRRRSLKAVERGRVAAITKAFGGEKPVAAPKPKPRNLTLSNEPLQRSVHITALKLFIYGVTVYCGHFSSNSASLLVAMLHCLQGKISCCFFLPETSH